MNNVLKLLIPLGLGVVAAAINWMVMTAGTERVEFVTVSKTLDVGEAFDLKSAVKLELPRDFRGLSKSLVPFSERGALSGRAVRRTIEPGDPVFFADTDLGGKWLALQPSEELFPVVMDQVAVDAQLLRIGNEIRFRVPPIAGEDSPPWIGPFRIVAVGSKINNNFSDARVRGGGGGLTIGIAYNEKTNAANLKRLETFCDMQQRGEATMLGVRVVDTR